VGDELGASLRSWGWSGFDGRSRFRNFHKGVGITKAPKTALIETVQNKLSRMEEQGDQQL